MTTPEPPAPGPATPPGSDAGRWTAPPPGWTPPPPRQSESPPQQFGAQPGYGPQYAAQPPGQASGPGYGGTPYAPMAAQEPFELLPDRHGNVPGQPAPPANRRRLAWVAAAVVVLLCAGLGVFLLRGASGDTNGAASPEAALRGAIDGVAAQDVAKVLSMVNPDEIKSLGSLIDVARKHLSESGVVSATGVVEPWLHLSVTGVRIDTQKPRDDLAFVTVTGGQATATVDQQAMPKSIRPSHPRTTRSAADLGPALSQTVIGVIKRGDRWFLSPTTTLLENLRRRLNLPAPDFRATVARSGGAATPQKAVTELVDAVAHRDLLGAASLVSSKEVPALAYYYDTFAAQLRPGLDQVSGAVSNLDTAVEDMTDGLKKVVIRGVDFSGSTGSGSASVQYRSGCVTSSQFRQRCLPGRFSALTGWHDPFVVVEQNDGGWQVSPIATVLEYARVFFTDGSINALYRNAGAFMLAPVTQTVQVGVPTTVKLNEAGFAHVTITGAPHSCIDESSDTDVWVAPTTWSYDGSCDGRFSIPASGTLDAVVLRQSWDGGTAQVMLRTR